MAYIQKLETRFLLFLRLGAANIEINGVSEVVSALADCDEDDRTREHLTFAKKQFLYSASVPPREC